MTRLLAMIAAVVAVSAAAQSPPSRIHGSADAYAAPGVAMAWAIKRGATEASTSVVVRVATDATYPWVAVGGIDPFTQQEQGILLAKPVDGKRDVRIPRSQFGDTPRTEWMFYPSERAAKAGNPSLVVYYLGVPDTTPEFADDAKLDAYLDATLARARAGGVKIP
jgi:hypothetical protein